MPSGRKLDRPPPASLEPVVLQAALAELATAMLENQQQEDARYDPSQLDDMVRYAEDELGMILRSVPRVLDAFLYAMTRIRDRQILRMACQAGRGGGKTELVAAIEVISWRWYGYDWQNVGGSLEQAERCFAYVREWCLSRPNLQAHTTDLLMSRTESVRGDKIRINAASEKSVRGPHPGGPKKGGGLVLDEVAVIDDRIVDASKFQVQDANPSAILQTSTMGERHSGRWHELVQAAKEKGYVLFEWDIFDVARRCPYDCAATCPIPEHFASDFYREEGGRKKLIHPAFCGGKAHQVDGWVSIDEIAQQFRDSDLITFMREAMGKGTRVIGKVYDPELLDAASVENVTLRRPDAHDQTFHRLEKSVGIDWGFAGEAALCYGVRVKDVVIVYAWEFYTEVRATVICANLVERIRSESISSVRADAEDPGNIDELRHQIDAASAGDDWADADVRPVAFNTWKGIAISEVRRRLEQEKILFPRHFGGAPVPNYEKAMKYLRAYKTDDQGRPIKKDDHGPDALSCLAVGYSTLWAGRPRVHV